jgi:leucyl aminopeptidase
MGVHSLWTRKLPWAHLDIAGPVWKDKTGGTGFAVSTLVEWVVKNSSALGMWS